MTLPRRRKAILLALLVYWPVMFVVTHIPQISRWVAKAQVSDKTAHFIAYLVLTFLWWFTISPYTKVKWKKPTVWWSLLVIVWYGAFDEYSQSFFGRNADVSDFLANLASVLAALVLLSIFTFWPASLAVTAIAIFAATNLSRINLAALLPIAYPSLHLFAYAFFALLWVHYLKRRPSPPSRARGKPRQATPAQPKWFLTASAVPLALLAGVKIFSALVGRSLWAADIIAAVAGITIINVTFYLTVLCRRHPPMADPASR